MKQSFKKLVAVLLLVLIIPFCLYAGNKYPKREMRAVWIATVMNIDWPSSRYASVEQQKKELVNILDLHRQNGMNAIVFQVRAGCDALYRSDLEPWSEWLTGTQGKAPEPFYDPLEFIVEECHKRNMELHAWINPFRAAPGYMNRVFDSSHIAISNPEQIIKYGSNMILDPGLPQTREHVSRVVADIVRRYDIDAIHMDDYFYPYKIKDKVFNDSLSFALYNRGYRLEEIDDWRRENVDIAVRQIQDSIKSIKPYVQFGISPFGVWRNKSNDRRGSRTKAGQTNYDDLYADVLKWVKEGWIDYLTPQIYWHIGFKLADFRILAKWWNRNSSGINTYIGHGIYRFNPDSDTREWREIDQIDKQVKLTRRLKNISGGFYFSSRSFARDSLGVNQTMRNNIYPYPALIPENPAVSGKRPDAPAGLKIMDHDGTTVLRWEHEAGPGTYYLVYRFRGTSLKMLKDPAYIYLITREKYCIIEAGENQALEDHSYIITAVSRTHNESKPSDMISWPGKQF